MLSNIFSNCFEDRSQAIAGGYTDLLMHKLATHQGTDLIGAHRPWDNSEDIEAPPKQEDIVRVDPGVSKVVRSGNKLRLLGSNAHRSVLLNGFNFGGQYSRSASSKVLALSQGEIELTESAIASAVLAEKFTGSGAWVALFAVASDKDIHAQLKVVPYFRVTSCMQYILSNRRTSTTVNKVKIDASVFELQANLSSTEMMIITEDGEFSGQIESVTNNGRYWFDFQSDDQVQLAEGDWLLPAPRAFPHYKYMGSYKVMVDPHSNSLLWESFTSGPNGIVETPGHVFSFNDKQNPNTSIDLQEYPQGTLIDFSGIISPLATRVKVINTSPTRTNSALYISHDEEGHLASLVQGVGAESWVNFGGSQTLWFSMGSRMGSAQLAVNGWQE